MTIPAGHRFEATQALRQVLARAVEWEMIDVNPAKRGVDNPQRRRTEKRPFESWAELEAVAAHLGPQTGPMVVFAAATGSSTGGVDRARATRHRPRRAGGPRPSRVPQRPDQVTKDPSEHARGSAPGRSRSPLSNGLPVRPNTPLLFPNTSGGYFDLHNFRNREWRPAQTRAGYQTVPSRLRSETYLCDLRAPCRRSDFRALPLHGREPDDDRPPLRPPRQATAATTPAVSSTSTAPLRRAPWTLVDAAWTSVQPARVTAENVKATSKQGKPEAL